MHRAWLMACLAIVVSMSAEMSNAWADDPPPPPPPPTELPPTPRGGPVVASQVPVPDVRGLSEQAARRALQQAGLRLAGVERISVDEVARRLGRRYPAGTVLQQAPAPSTGERPSWLARGGAVYLRVTQGSTTTPAAPPSTTPPPSTTTPPRTSVPTAPRTTTPYVPPRTTGPTYPAGTRPPPPPAPDGTRLFTGPSTTPGTVITPSPTTIPYVPPTTTPYGTQPPGPLEVPSARPDPDALISAGAIRSQVSLPCERLRDTWSIQGRAGWAFSAGSDSGDGSFAAGFDVTRWWSGCFGLGMYYRYTGQTFDRQVSGGLLEDAGAFHHLGLKLNYQSTFSLGSRMYWWAGLGFGWFETTDYQKNDGDFEGYAEGGLGFLINRRMRMRLGVDVLAVNTKAGRYDPGKDGSSRLLWFFTPQLAFEYDL